MIVRPFDLTSDDPIEQAGAWCLRLSEGALTPDEQDRFDGWLESDEVHRRAFDDAIRAWRAVEQAAVAPEVVNMRSAALIAFRRGQRARWAPQALRSRWAVPAVAVLLIVLIGGAGLWITTSSQSYQTAIGERRVVFLSDGSKVSLDAATRIEARYYPNRRQLRLAYGRAKFTVAGDPKRPFTVAAADKVVLATGTEFSVELLRGQVQVILYKGHVAVLDEVPGSAPPQHVALASTSAAADQSLTPGRELVVPVAQQTAQVMAVDPVRTLSWEGGQLVFIDEPLSSAVERINRYSDNKLSIADEAAGRVLISGNFTAGDTAAFIEGVTGVFPVQIHSDGVQKKFVSKRR